MVKGWRRSNLWVANRALRIDCFASLAMTVEIRNSRIDDHVGADPCVRPKRIEIRDSKFDDKGEITWRKNYGEEGSGPKTWIPKL